MQAVALIILAAAGGFAVGRMEAWGAVSREWARISAEWGDLSAEWARLRAHLRDARTPPTVDRSPASVAAAYSIAEKEVKKARKSA